MDKILIQDQFSQATVVCIDGGQGELLVSSNSAIIFIRIAAVSFSANVRKNTVLYEILLDCTPTLGEWKIQPISLDTQPLKNPNVLLTWVKQLGRIVATPEELGSTLRSHAENYVRGMYANTSIRPTIDCANFVLLIDGSLDKQHAIIDALVPSGLIIACAKHSQYSAVVEGFEKPWYSSCDAKNNPLFPKGCASNICLLHPRGQVTLRIDTACNSPTFDLSKVMSILVQYSKDSVFPGYPYPLILADALARISQKETKNLSELLSYALPDGKRRKQEALQYNPHEYLDSLQY